MVSIRPITAWTDPLDGGRPRPGRPLLDALGLREHLVPTGSGPAVVAVAVGGGGKTTLVHSLGLEAAALGLRVLLTTTTHMMNEPGMATSVAQVRERLARPGLLTAARPISDQKSGSFDIDDLDRLREIADAIFIEGDGSRHLPIKVPADHEPVVPAFSDLVLVVTGLRALGRPMSEVCHRLPTAVAQLDDPELPGRTLTPQLAADLLRAGYLTNPKLLAWEQRRAVVLNQADDLEMVARGRRLAALLDEHVLITGWA